MGVCERCALVQLRENPPAEAVAPRVPWIFYNEPEGHLDPALDKLADALGMPGHAIGVGPFDGPLLKRLEARGWSTETLDMLADHAAEGGTYPYLETLQARLRPGGLPAPSQKADLVVCRYLLEHSHAPQASLRALAGLLKPGGQLMIEVPDSTKFLTRHDYSFIWEEHLCYFTPDPLRRLFAAAGCEVLDIFQGEGLQEDLLLAVVRPASDVQAAQSADPVEIALFTGFANAFAEVRQANRAAIAKADGKVALFGAGHQAIMFANALGLMSGIAVLADDHPDKLGTWAPGACGPIVSSAAVDADPSIGVCLLSTSPRIEDKIRSRLGQFLARGGRIYSIYSGIGRPTLIDPAP